MPGKFCVSLTHAKNDTDKATVAFVVANAAVGSDQETIVFLSTEAVRLAQRGYADEIHEEGFAPLKELMEKFVLAGGRILSAPPVSRSESWTKTRWFKGRPSSAEPSWSSSWRRARLACRIEPRSPRSMISMPRRRGIDTNRLSRCREATYFRCPTVSPDASRHQTPGADV